MTQEQARRDPDQLKLLLRLPQSEDGLTPYGIESLWVSPRPDGTYEVDNIPFFSYDVAVGDVVRAEEDGGDLYFEELVQASGNSVIRVKLPNEAELLRLHDELRSLGCDSESFGTLLAVNIPAQVAYEPIFRLLEKGEKDDRWGFEEAVLAHKSPLTPERA